MKSSSMYLTDSGICDDEKVTPYIYLENDRTGKRTGLSDYTSKVSELEKINIIRVREHQHKMLFFDGKFNKSSSKYY